MKMSIVTRTLVTKKKRLKYISKISFVGSYMFTLDILILLKEKDFIFW